MITTSCFTHRKFGLIALTMRYKNYRLLSVMITEMRPGAEDEFARTYPQAERKNKRTADRKNFTAFIFTPAQWEELKRTDFRELGVHDILPDFDSYIADVEWNLKHDLRSWRMYQKDATPFIIDLLCDFGEWDKFGKLNSRDVQSLAQTAARNYTGRK